MKSENYPGIKRKLIFNTIIFRFHVSFWGWFSCWTSNMWRISDGIRFPSYMGRSPDRSGPDCLLPELNTIPVVKVGLSPLLTHFSGWSFQPFGPQWAGLIWSLDRLDMQLVLRSGVAMDTTAEFSKILMSFHSFMTFMVRCSYKYNISYKCSDLDVEISKSLHVSCPTFVGFPGQKTSQVWISCLSGRCLA